MRQRIINDLRVNEAAAEAILRLRNQVDGLRSHDRQLEIELPAQVAGQYLCLARYREVY